MIEKITREYILRALGRLDELLRERGVSGEVCIFGGLEEAWLNDGVKGFLSDQGEVTSAGMPVFENLRVQRPTTEYLLAMKCLASRVGDYSQEGDRGDVTRLLKELEMSKPSEVCKLVEGFYKESQVPAKVRFFIEEVCSEL